MDRILIKTTIPHWQDDWHVGRFSLLKAHLEGLKGSGGDILFDVTARNREADAAGDDPDLVGLATSEFDQLWLFAVDVNDAITERDARGVQAFRRRGGGLFMTRDHQDMGKSLLRLGRIGLTQCFQSANPEPDETRRGVDDTGTPAISWPNYNSGRNGGYQEIRLAASDHPLLRRPSGGSIRYLPSHPHEGVVVVPEACAACAKVLIEGRSALTGRPFNIAVAVEGEMDEDGTPLGRAVSQSTFHHFADYNWDTDSGCPSFVTETPGTGLKDNAEAAADARVYAANIAAWLA